MSIFNFLGDMFKPAADLIDNIHTSDEEKLSLKNKMEVIQNEMKARVLSYEQTLMKAQSEVIKSEAQGQSWLQRSWRPITMLTFLFLVVCDSFGWLTNRLADQAWILLQIGLGGYVIGRSAEKMMPSIVESIQKKK
ncbi:holin family protein [bacterium]|nr:holin family protein [bacterium]